MEKENHYTPSKYLHIGGDEAFSTKKRPMIILLVEFQRLLRSTVKYQ